MVLFFWRIVGLGLVPYGYDLLTYFVPYKAYLAQLLRQGEIPLWNPMIFLGAPLLANIQAAVLYPLDLLFYLMPTWEALRCSVVLHVFLAAFFTYLFGRLSLGLSPPAAWLAGTSFGFGGFIGAHVGHLNQLHAVVWLPLLLLFLERASSRRGVAAIPAGALTFAAQLLAGHTQEVYYSVWAVGLFALYLAVFRPHPGLVRLWPLVSLAAILGLGALVASVQLLPTLELARESYRSGGIPYREAVAYSVPLKELLDSVLPLYFEQPYVELVGYVGVVAVVLLPAALARRSLASLPWFFAGMAALALLLSLGDATPLYGWLHRWAPGFDLFRAPGRWLFLYNFGMAILAGMGLDALRAERDGIELREWLARYGVGLALGLVLLLGLRSCLAATGQEPSLPHPRAVLAWTSFALAAVALSLALVSRPRSPWALVLLLAIGVLELHQAKEPLEYNRPTHASLYSQSTPQAATLGEPSTRTLSLAQEKFELPNKDSILRGLPPHMEPAETTSYLEGVRIKEVLAPNTGMALGLSSPDGYDGGLLPTRRYALFKHHLLQGKQYRPDRTIREDDTAVPGSRLLGSLGVAHLILNQGRGGYDDGWVEVQGQAGGAVKTLRNSRGRPRAYVAHAARIVEDEAQLLEALATAEHGEEVLLAEKIPFEPPGRAGEDRVLWVADRPNEVVVDATLESPGFLVLSDSYYPGWKVYVDGREERLLRANYLLRAVQLPAGQHRVRFAYEPSSVTIGLAFSLVGLALVLLAPFVACRFDSHERNR